MSVRMTGKAWELDLDPLDKLLLLALTDHADHDGHNIRPGNDLLCAKTGLSERTVSGKLAKFVQMGVLEPESDVTGRGHRREFRANLDGVPRHKYFIERDTGKVEGVSTFTKKKVEAGTTFKKGKVEADAGKVEADAGKVEADDKSHDKERARMNRHEPSIEPSIAAPQPGASSNGKKSVRRDDPFYLLFRQAYTQIGYEVPYQHKKGDFVQLANLRELCEGHNWPLTEERFKLGLANYFRSEMGEHTLADLCARFSIFYKSPLDRFNQPMETNGNGHKNGNGSHSPAPQYCDNCSGARRVKKEIDGKIRFEKCSACNGTGRKEAK